MYKMFFMRILKFWAQILKQNSFTKKSVHSEENNLLHTKIFLGFVKRFGEFAKIIYETRDWNFFNFALIIAVFLLATIREEQ